MLQQNLLLLVAVNGNFSVMFLVQNRISRIIPGRKHRVLCIWPFLFISFGEPPHVPAEVLNHERIHARQQLEMGWVFFFVWYGLEFLVRWVQYRDRLKTYRALSHEKEAYQHEGVQGYLKVRKPYAWRKYL
jgi:hypothetical protein